MQFHLLPPFHSIFSTVACVTTLPFRLHPLLHPYFISSSLRKAIYVHISLSLCNFPDAFLFSFALAPHRSPNLLRYQPSFPSTILLPTLLYLLFPSPLHLSKLISFFHYFCFLYPQSSAYLYIHILPSPSINTRSFTHLCHGAL